jgi:phosphoglucosamine mutase
VFRELGAEVVAIANEPNGLNINEQCGATNPKRLQQQVVERNADLGIALDGDGDRLIMVDHTGEVVDGDEELFVIAMDRYRSGSLTGAVVGTVMSNLGLEKALNRVGIELKRAPVGDRYVMDVMQSAGLKVGGEGSGHIICLDRTTTGDGIVSALQVLSAMRHAGESLHSLKQGMHKFPQVLINVPTAGNANVQDSVPIMDAVREAEERLEDTGRVLLRASGTEPLIRVMVEGQDEAEVRAVADELARVVDVTVGLGAHPN